MDTRPRKSRTIYFRIVLGLAIGFFAFDILLIISTIGGTRQSLGVFLNEQLESKYETFQTSLKQSITDVQNQLNICDAIPFGEEIKEQKKETIESQLVSFAKTSSIDGAFIVDAQGTILYGPEKDAHRFANNDRLGNAVANGMDCGLSVVTNNISIVGAVQIPKSEGSYLILEKVLSTNSQADYYHNLLGCAFTIFNDDIRMVTSITDEKGVRILGTKLNNDEIYKKVYTDHQKYYGNNKIQGANYLTLYAPVETAKGFANSIIFIGMPIAIQHEMQNSLLVKTVPVALLLSILLSISIILLITIIIMKPINKARTAVKNLAQESTDTDLTYRIHLQKDDEVGELCNDIDIFMDRLQQIIIELKNRQKSLETIGSTLSVSSQESASAIAEILSNIESVHNQTNVQMQTITTTNKEMKNNLDCVEKLDVLIQNQSSGLVESSASIEEMIGNINSVNGSVQKMNESFKELMDVSEHGNQTQEMVSQKVSKMATQSQALMEANSVIAQIASQTNLLAMNAAIEAAHAGESGKGFSVVADEIRKLAETSSRQSHAIAAELKEIVDSIKDVVESSKSSQSAFSLVNDKIGQTDTLSTEISQAMMEQSAASKQILSALHDVNGANAEVSLTSKDMKSSTLLISKQMEDLTQVVDVVNGSMDEMSAGAVQIRKSAQGVTDMAGETHENIQTMDRLIGKFRV